MHGGAPLGVDALDIDDPGDIDPSAVKAALAEVLPGLLREARWQQLTAGLQIVLDESANRHHRRETQMAAIRAALPEIIAREIRRRRGRLD